MMLKVVAGSDVVITTALIPGKRGADSRHHRDGRSDAAGSVVVDLAAERGGNCELTRPDEIVVHQGVTIIGPSNPAALVPYHASQMYSKNIVTFLLHLLGKDGAQQPRCLRPRGRDHARDAADFIVDAALVRACIAGSRRAPGFEVVDLESTNGTYVNGQRIAARHAQGRRPAGRRPGRVDVTPEGG